MLVLSWLVLIWLAAPPIVAQSLRVYSEFARIDPSGEVTAPAQPREILSPAIVRNGFTSFQIVVQVKGGTPYWLYVGENPDNAVKVSMYRETGEQLEPLTSPYHGDTTQIFWLDLFADRNAIVRRIKIEPELDVNEDWVVYPMEVRVMDARVPDDAPNAVDPLELLCGQSRSVRAVADAPDARSMAQLQKRNRTQDAALSAGISKDRFARAIGTCESFQSVDPERYLRIRDYLFRMR